MHYSLLKPDLLSASRYTHRGPHNVTSIIIHQPTISPDLPPVHLTASSLKAATI